MTALESMIRVHGWILEEKRRGLAEIESFVDELRRDLEILDKNVNAEREAAGRSEEANLAYPVFVAAALDRRKRLRDTIGNLEQQVDAAREAVAEAFQELKAYELAYENQKRREAAERARAERIDLDELGVSLHRRKSVSGD